MKLTKEDLDKVRHVEGFPIAKDEDIISLSNPPYYTSCPNPFIENFIKEHGKPYDEATDDYHREPFAADVSEGKNSRIYMAHAYHTKVPYKAIMRYILHYTEPGDIVLDGFCGTGMTGVAAQMCSNPDNNPEFKLKIEKEMPYIKWGARKAILNDLSPAAAFISYNYNSPIDIVEFEKEANIILNECEKELGWMYETNHVDEKGNQIFDVTGPVKGKINYTVWSDVFICPSCGKEIIFWNVAVDRADKKIRNLFNCKECGTELKKKDCLKAETMYFDKLLNATVKISKQIPTLINYSVNGKRYEKIPDELDLENIERINGLNFKYPLSISKLPDGYNTEQPKRSNSIHYIHQFFTNRSLMVLSKMFSLVKSNKLRFVLTSIIQNATKMYKFRTDGKGGIVTGTLYIPALNQENNIFNLFKNKLKMIVNAQYKCDNKNYIISTNSTTNHLAYDNSIDYIFTDPPFGANINYSELNFLWESWIKVFTNNKMEAISNSVQGKGMLEYQELMTKCFREYFRILKPNRWMTVEFHNSKNAVWNSIQESLQKAGFIVADVRTLDKKQGSFKQVTTTSAIKQDLVISAYKPQESFNREFLAHAGSEETAWNFVRQHLEKLPTVVKRNDKIELIAERQAFLLFDRMVAYHIMQGIPVPLDASDFYKGLDQKFLKRDGMYFLYDQINEYDTARITIDVESIQMTILVSDEKTAISWLYKQLEIPQTYAEIQPKFMKEVRSIDKYEKLPELSVLLEENFLQNNQGKWYIPDVTKSADIMKLREKRLIKEFEDYLNSKGKLKQFRTEAIRAGFAKLWKEKNYELIVKTAERIPEKVIQEDDKLLMYYDISLSRI